MLPFGTQKLLLFGGMESKHTYSISYDEEMVKMESEALPGRINHFSYGERNKCTAKEMDGRVFATDVNHRVFEYGPKGWKELDFPN